MDLQAIKEGCDKHKQTSWKLYDNVSTSINKQHIRYKRTMYDEVGDKDRLITKSNMMIRNRKIVDITYKV